jgi:RHS repeat-associated protein
MELASNAFSTGVPASAAIPQLAGNSRQGFGLQASTSCLGSGFSISSNTLGLSTSLYDGDAGSRSTGKERDTESGNDYFGARYYSSAMGRFTSPDPIPISLEIDNPQSWNKYSYAFNRPLSLVDPNGKWPTWYHNEIIENNFSRLGPHAVSILETYSAVLDNWQGQQNSMDFEHAMSMPGQSAAEASAMTSQFIDDAIHSAVTMQILFESAGNKGYSDSALMYFALALHPTTDNYSPEHHGFQVWDITNLAADAKHIRDENYSSKSSDADSEEARYLANVAAAQLWGTFQNDLAQSREAQKKKNQPKIGCAMNERCSQ